MSKVTNENVDETKEDISFDARVSTVFYEQWYKVIKDLTPKERDKAYRYIFEYAFYGIEPEKDKTSSMSYVVFGMAKPNIDSAHRRYDAALENGKKGGRPSKVTEEVREKILELRKNGMTQKDVALELSLSLKTIQRVEKETRQNQSQNHNENVNVNENGNGNDKKIELVSEASSETPPTPLELTWEEYTLLMDVWESSQGTGKSPTQIARELKLDCRLCNQAITDYKNNHYKRKDNPNTSKKLDVLLSDGSYYSCTKEDLFNEATDYGKADVDDVAWEELKEGYIDIGIDPDTVNSMLKEFEVKLLKKERRRWS